MFCLKILIHICRKYRVKGEDFRKRYIIGGDLRVKDTKNLVSVAPNLRAFQKKVYWEDEINKQEMA